jgi:beta-N-acetylhexosaminidase
MSIGNLMIDIQGTCLTMEDKELLSHPSIAGVILFSRNFTSIPQLQDLIFSIRACTQQSLLIAVDQEGGRVQRFSHGFTPLPALYKLGQCYEKNPHLALKIAHEAAWLMAAEVLSVGIDFSFAPVLDLYNEASRVINDRSFHHDPSTLLTLAHAYIDGMHEAGMAATGKHFPGHGNVIEDSHVETPIDPRDFNTIMANDLLPFTKLANKLTAIMPAHVIYESVEMIPAGFSVKWLQDILRNQLKFYGAIISDDLSMEGAAMMGSFNDRIKQATLAGCDMFLICNNRNAVKETMHKMPAMSETSRQRLLKLCGHFRYTYTEIQQDERAQATRQLLKELA